MDHEPRVNILKELLTQLDEGKNIDVRVQYKMSTTGYSCPEIAAREHETVPMIPANPTFFVSA